jgi:hypothetical protein
MPTTLGVDGGQPRGQLEDVDDVAVVEAAVDEPPEDFSDEPEPEDFSDEPEPEDFSDEPAPFSDEPEPLVAEPEVTEEPAPERESVR